MENISYKQGYEYVNIYDLYDVFDVGVLIIAQPYRYYSSLEDIFEFLERNKGTIKKIICTWEEIEDKLLLFSNRNSIELNCLGYEINNMKINNNTLYQIRTPIIFVASKNEFADKFCVQMNLYNYFSIEGYNPQLIGSKKYSELLGIKSFPNFMFKKDYSNVEKIIMFNHYIKNIEDDNQPDVIIVGIPGEIDGFINGLSLYFDDIPYLVSNAIKPDITIINILFNDLKYSANLKKSILYRYGWELDAIYVNNFMLDLQLSQSHRKHQYIKIQRNTLKEEILNVKEKKNYFSYNNIHELSKLVLDKLLNYGEESIV